MVDSPEINDADVTDYEMSSNSFDHEMGGGGGNGDSNDNSNNHEKNDDINSNSSNDNTSENADKHAHIEQERLKALAKLICFEKMPPRIVEDFHFKELMHLVSPQFEVDLPTIERECLEVYKEEKTRIKEFFTKFDGNISLSIDILMHEKGTRYITSYCQEYLCLTAHFIDESWKLKKWVLSFHRVLGENNVFPDKVILEALADLGIEEKVSTLTMVDSNCYNETVKLVKSHIEGKKVFPLNGQLFRLYCCGDIISIMVQDAFEEIKDIIDKVCELYSFGRSVPLWYLTSNHLKQALQLWDGGEFSSEDVIDDYDVPSAEEWKKVKSVCTLVDSIYEVANVLFEAKNSTTNLYLYHLYELKAILNQASTSSDDYVAHVAEEMLKKFNKYWKDMFLVLAIATMLDPRFKMKYIEFTCSKFQGTESKSQIADVMETIRSLYDDYVTHFPLIDDFPESEDSDSDVSNSEDGSPLEVDSIESFTVLQDYQQFIQSASQLPKSDLDRYLEEPVLSWKQDFSVLGWWRSARAKYPTLSRMARDFLAIPISLATSFEAFYTEKRPADEGLVRSRPNLRNALMCTRSWYERPKKALDD